MVIIYLSCLPTCTYTHTPLHLLHILVGPSNFRPGIGDSGLREAGFSTTAMIKTSRLPLVVSLNTTYLFRLSLGNGQKPPEASLESREGERRVAVEAAFHHTGSNLKMNPFARLQHVLGAVLTSDVHHGAVGDHRPWSCVSRVHLNTHTFMENSHRSVRILIDHLLILVKSFSLSKTQFPHMEKGVKYFAESLGYLHKINVKSSSRVYGKSLSLNKLVGVAILQRI